MKQANEKILRHHYFRSIRWILKELSINRFGRQSTELFAKYERQFLIKN